MEHEARLGEAIKEALRSRQKSRLSVLRLMLAELQRQQKDQGPVSEKDGWKIFQRMVRQREEASDKFKEGGRPELARAEEEEITVIREFLPVPLEPAQLEQHIEAALQQSGGVSIRDMSKIMAILSTELQGRVDMKELSTLVRQRLTG